MSRKSLQAAIFTATVGLWLPIAATAQTKAQRSNPSDSAVASAKAAKAAKTPAKLPLKDITFISTSEAAREAAETTEAKKPGQSASTPRTSKLGQPGNGGVLEFHHAQNKSSTSSESGAVLLKSHKKTILKGIHGSVYGSTATTQGAADRTVDGAIGAGSGNGKFNIFVETQHSQASTPAPH
ncbi:MAG: hypothetical protein M1404_03415 [Acidobacteria bacterium]|nr:hypothetical protein [Acidobacteriota bacterium]